MLIKLDVFHLMAIENHLQVHQVSLLVQVILGFQEGLYLLQVPGALSVQLIPKK